jgi:sugar/nucleoside kinase (ribokinase family)
VEVIDMVGAGGACMSALLAGLHRRGLLGAARRFTRRSSSWPAVADRFPLSPIPELVVKFDSSQRR